MHPSRILNGSLAVLLLAARASAQDVTFARDDYASYAGARAIVAGDFDRNGAGRTSRRRTLAATRSRFSSTMAAAG